VIYAKEFFDLQLTFARTVSALSGLPLTHTLFQYTNLYIRFGLGRAFDDAHPVWQQFVAGLAHADDAGDWTYRFYLTRDEATAGPSVVASFGCFSYARLSDGRLRLHFRNVDAEGQSPLARDRVPHRMADLTALFAHIKATEPGPRRMVGASWLYNVDAYRRLFPIAYLSTARALTGRFRHMPLWGQFVDRHGAVKAGMTRPFLAQLARQTSVDDLDRCFPLPVLTVEAPADDFYAFYSV